MRSYFDVLVPQLHCDPFKLKGVAPQIPVLNFNVENILELFLALLQSFMQIYKIPKQ